MSKLFFYEHHTPFQHIDTAVDYLQQVVEQIKLDKEIILNNNLASGNKIMPIVYCNMMNKVSSNIGTYASKKSSVNSDGELKVDYGRWGSDGNRTVTETCELALTHANILLEKSKKIHESNLEALKNNVELKLVITEFMTSVGFRKSTFIDETARRKTVSREVNTGWVNDMNTYIKTDDGFSTVDRDYKNILYKIDEYRKVELQKETATKYAKDNEEKSRKGIEIKAAITVKYKLPYDSSWEDISMHLLSLDRYLDLAHGMESTRNDWSCGFDDAIDAIQNFDPVDTIDFLIQDSLQTLIQDNDLDDGRTFRDCDWNYNEIYPLANKEILDDFYIVDEFINKY